MSVVVPVFNVEAYLAECLESIQSQSYSNLEIVVVVDGATDGSEVIARERAAKDGRIEVVSQENRGLGAARNAGILRSTGDLLAFVDSDDVVAPRAYERMVGTLSRTKSQVVVGAVERFTETRSFMTPLMRENHRAHAEGVRVEKSPLLLADVFAWNKVYSRSFWDRYQLAFPEGVRYEDQPTLTEALIAADSIDVLTDVVYKWRVRSDGSSLSQGRATLEDLHDRMLTKRWSTQLVLDKTSRPTQEVWYSRILPIDMWEYFRAAVQASDEYWRALRAGLHEFWNETTVPFWRTSVPRRQRLMGFLVEADRRSDLVTLIDFLDQSPRPPVGFRSGAQVLGLPIETDGIPSELLSS